MSAIRYVEDIPGNVSVEKAIEALLIVTSEPVAASRLASVLDIDISDVEDALDRLQTFYSDSGRGFFLQRVAGGYRLASVPEVDPVLEKFALSLTSPRLSGAALETLAIIAYRQPISRNQIAAIRGVNSDSVVKLLVSRGYVETAGRDSGPGAAQLFATTDFFLERLGLFSLDDLPPVDGFLPSPEVAEALEASLFDET